MLEGLKKENIQCAVVSNKRIEVVKRGLKQSGLDVYFDVVLGKENLPEPKPLKLKIQVELYEGPIPLKNLFAFLQSQNV